MDILLALVRFFIDNAPELVGIVLPPVVDFINKDVPNEQEKFIVTVLVCLVAALFLKWNNITYGTPEAIFLTASIIFLESQAVFKLYFKNSYIREKIKEKVEPKRVEPVITEALSGNPEPVQKSPEL